MSDRNTTPGDSVESLTKSVPVQFERIEPPHQSQTHNRTPYVGRYWLGEDLQGFRSPFEIPHKDASPILIAGPPRSAKSSTLASLAYELQTNHGYSYISLFDDGRMETPRMALPTSDEDVIDSLRPFSKDPTGIETEVFYPDSCDVLGEFPENFTPFTIDPDDIPREFKASAGMDALERAGIVGAPDAETNLDMEAVIADQSAAAVLCCNFLDEDHRAAKYALADLWAQLIFEARDTNPRLPRVVLGIRGLKHVAPATLSDSEHSNVVRCLRETMHKLFEEGASRRILILAEAQHTGPPVDNLRGRISDRISGPVQTHCGPRILFGMGPAKDYARGFGELVTFHNSVGPIEFRPAPCSLGDGSTHWLDEYGE